MGLDAVFRVDLRLSFVVFLVEHDARPISERMVGQGWSKVMKKMNVPLSKIQLLIGLIRVWTLSIRPSGRVWEIRRLIIKQRVVRGQLTASAA